MENPENYKNVMITYKKEISSGHYGIVKSMTEVTKRGFYSPLFKHYAVPPDWRMFNGNLLPHGWGGDKLQPKQVITWTYCE